MRIDFSLVQLWWVFFVCVFLASFLCFAQNCADLLFGWMNICQSLAISAVGKLKRSVVANKSLCTNHSSRMRVLVQLWHITLVRAIHANNKCFVVSFPRLAPKLNVLEVEEALLLPSTHILANTRGKIPPSRQKILCPVQGLAWRD